MMLSIGHLIRLDSTPAMKRFATAFIITFRKSLIKSTLVLIN